jgi:hypothetical protein
MLPETTTGQLAEDFYEVSPNVVTHLNLPFHRFCPHQHMDVVKLVRRHTTLPFTSYLNSRRVEADGGAD